MEKRQEILKLIASMRDACLVDNILSSDAMGDIPPTEGMEILENMEKEGLVVISDGLILLTVLGHSRI